MTLCIAATCCEKLRDNYIVLCSDMKIGTWAARAEIGIKLRWARLDWPALISGDLSRCAGLVKTFSSYLNQMELDHDNVHDAMKTAGNMFREKLADEIAQRNLSVSYEYLKKNKGKFPRVRVLETYNQIGRIDSEAELIVTGFIKSQPYIFVVERDCSVTVRDNFACIGTGAYIAEPALYQRHQSHAFTLGKTLYHTYDAKRLGEIAEGVGHHTIIIAVAPPGKSENRFMPISLGGMEFMEKQYQRYGLKSTLKFKWPKAKKSLRSESEIIRTASKKSQFL